MTTTVGLSGEFTVRHISREQLEAQCGTVMEALLELEGTGCGITSSAVSLDLATFTVTIEVEATGEDFDEAVAVADSCIRSAIHKAGGATPDGWDYQQQQRHAQLVTA